MKQHFFFLSTIPTKRPYRQIILKVYEIPTYSFQHIKINVTYRGVYEFTRYPYQSSWKECVTEFAFHGEVVARNIHTHTLHTSCVLHNEFSFRLAWDIRLNHVAFGSFQLICLHIVEAIKISWNNRVIVTCTWECYKEQKNLKIVEIHKEKIASLVS